MDCRYWPRQFDEMASDQAPVSWLNEAAPPNNVSALVPRQRSTHTVLVENLNSTQALLTRLENGRVHVARAEQREVVRLLYVATRHQVRALAATLELDGLE
jgi:hypothetical protein